MFMVSCDDEQFLDVLPKDTSTVENYYVDTPGFEAALNGLYATIREEYQSGIISYALYNTGTDIGMNGTHPAGHHQSFGSYTGFSPSIGSIRTRWGWGYDAITRANFILKQLESPDIVWDSPDDPARVEAEAKFMRAWAYRYLVWSFGDIPLITEPLTEPKTDFTRQSTAEIWNLIRSDVEFAAEHLPVNTSLPGKLTKGAAQHLLAEVYLTLGENALAEDMAIAVINSGKYTLMTQRFGSAMSQPGDVFNDLFEFHNQNDPSNTETIWAVQLEVDLVGGNESIDVTGRMWTPRYFQVRGLKNEFSVYGPPTGQLRATDFMTSLYEPGDIRFSAHNWRTTFFYNDEGNLPPGVSLGDTVVVTPQNRNFLYSYPLKWFFPYHPTNPNYGQNRHDRYHMRLSETYLLLAEAQFKQGNLQDAADNINMVRARANASLINPGDVDMDFILDERARELFGEYPRRFTLLRTGKFLERIRAHNPEGGPNVQEMHQVFPIPQAVIDANVGLEFPQNPGYIN